MGAMVTIVKGTASLGATVTTAHQHQVLGPNRVLSRDEAKQEVLWRSMDGASVPHYIGDIAGIDSVGRALTEERLLELLRRHEEIAADKDQDDYLDVPLDARSLRCGFVYKHETGRIASLTHSTLTSTGRRLPTPKTGPSLLTIAEMPAVIESRVNLCV